MVIPNKKPRFPKKIKTRGQGYDCKWDFISNTKWIKYKMLNNWQLWNKTQIHNLAKLSIIILDLSFYEFVWHVLVKRREEKVKM